MSKLLRGLGFLGLFGAVAFGVTACGNKTTKTNGKTNDKTNSKTTSPIFNAPILHTAIIIITKATPGPITGTKSKIAVIKPKIKG